MSGSEHRPRGLLAGTAAGESRPSLKRFTVVLVLTGVASYAVLFALTTWLGQLGETEPLRVSGDSLSQRVSTATTEVHRRYPNVVVDVIGVTPEQVMFKVGWKLPGSSVDDYAAEITERVQDQREATVLLLKAVALREPSVRYIGAYEDNLIVPIWDRRQIIHTEDPATYRDWDTYSRFQRSATKHLGYARLNSSGP